MGTENEDLAPPAWAFDRALQRRRLEATISALAPEMRRWQARQMHQLGMTYEAIGSKLGISPSRARVLGTEE